MDKKDCSSGFLLEDIVVEMKNHEIIGLQVKEMAGFVYNPITGRWLLSQTT